MRSAIDGLLALLERADSRRPNLLRILTYHRVGDPETFEQHLRHLKSSHHVTSLAELLDAIAGRCALPPRSVMITFDDGYREVGEVAWPRLRALALPAILFVPTAFPATPDEVFWWDRLEHAVHATPRRDQLATPAGRLALATSAQRSKACSRLKLHLRSLHHDEARRVAESVCRQLEAPPAAGPALLGWEDLRRLAGEGLTIGAHSRTHPLLSMVSPAEARSEVFGAQEDLRSRLGQAPPIFCYPDGRYAPPVLDALREAGIVAAFTTRRGTNDLATEDPLLLRRINVGRGDALPALRARLIHSSVYFNRVRRLFDPQPLLNGCHAASLDHAA